MNSPKGQDNLAKLTSDMEKLSAEVKALSESTKALVEAWNTATNVVKFVKVLSSIIAALGVVWFFITHGFTRAP